MAERSKAVEEQAVRDASAVYSVEAGIATAEDVPPGYKRTDVGVIPVDWEFTAFSNVIRHHSGNSALIKGNLSPSPGSRLFPGFSASGQDIWCSGYEYEGNAVVVSAVGSRCGKAFVASGKWNAIANTHVVWPVTSKIDWRFLSLLLNREDFWLKSGSGQPFVMFKQTFTRPLFLPPLSEQTAIATALLDADALIESLDLLIAKKRAIKQAAMQQLLTGQARLPGFTGNWECTTFSTVVHHHSGNSSLIKGRLSPSPQSDFYPGFSASGQDIWCDGYEHEGNAIVVSAVGSRCGKAFIASGKWNAIANTHVVWPVTNRIELRFLSLFLDREDFWLKGGSGQPFVMFKQTFSRQLFLPSIKEQTAIAKVLSDMDTEIEALERRSDKARKIKQGMMKQLLTGRVRLVEAKGEAGE